MASAKWQPFCLGLNVLIKSSHHHTLANKPGISLGMHPANERRRSNVTKSLIGWAHT